MLGASCQFSGGTGDLALPAPSQEAAAWFGAGDAPLPSPSAHVPAKFRHGAQDMASWFLPGPC